MNTRSLIATLAVCAAALAVSVVMSNAGPLSPPAGPIAPTNKTLTEVEPRIAVNAANTPGDTDVIFQIKEPGSYYLTGDIVGVAGKHGVRILSSDVALDLNGFTLQGSPTAFNGILVDGAFTNIIIKNGMIRGWGLSGAQALNASRSTLRDLRTSGNGVHGLQVGENCLIESTAADSNQQFGMVIGAGSVVVGCSASQNTLSGVFASTGVHISQSTARLNGGDGFATSSGGAIIGCAATNNGDDGIDAGGATAIIDNAAAFNTGDGIEASSDALVRGNACDSNGLGVGDGAGIHLLGADARVEGNTVTDNDRGIDVDVSGNFIVRNSASGNTVNYDIVSGNVCFVVLASTSGAILGSSGGVSPGTTSPWANFSF